MYMSCGQVLDASKNGCGHFSVVNGIVTFQRTSVSYEALQEQNYWLTNQNMVMQNMHLGNFCNYYYPIVSDQQMDHENEIIK